MFPYWDKYQLTVHKTNLEKGQFRTEIIADPQYPNGHLLAVLLGHTPIAPDGYRLSLPTEIALIKELHLSPEENKRIPIIDEVGQIAVYADQAYLYDTLKNGSVIDENGGYYDTYDDKNEKPIMVIPTADMIGLLEDTQRYLFNQ
ncbi:MAG: hypothetical protein KDE26_28180 [Bacteroidetes bacterium]|nr:hypothetical protein [Bacteroidota bacterium]MCB0847174.1 hypothetical protein [Bacteroidota bacterium]